MYAFAWQSPHDLIPNFLSFLEPILPVVGLLLINTTTIQSQPGIWYLINIPLVISKRNASGSGLSLAEHLPVAQLAPGRRGPYVSCPAPACLPIALCTSWPCLLPQRSWTTHIRLMTQSPSSSPSLHCPAILAPLSLPTCCLGSCWSLSLSNVAPHSWGCLLLLKSLVFTQSSHTL